MLHGQTLSHEFLKNRIVFEIDYGSIRHAEDAGSALAGLNSPVDAQPASAPTRLNLTIAGYPSKQPMNSRARRDLGIGSFWDNWGQIRPRTPWDGTIRISFLLGIPVFSIFSRHHFFDFELVDPGWIPGRDTLRNSGHPTRPRAHVPVHLARPRHCRTPLPAHRGHVPGPRGGIRSGPLDWPQPATSLHPGPAIRRTHGEPFRQTRSHPPLRGCPLAHPSPERLPLPSAMSRRRIALPHRTPRIPNGGKRSRGRVPAGASGEPVQQIESAGGMNLFRPTGS